MATDPSLVALHRARRRNRRQHIDWFEVFYQTYITTILVAIGLTYVSGSLDDPPLSTSALDSVAEHGPAVLGILAAAAIGAALRSGSRGGPLVLEAADVRYVLLAPLPRSMSLRRPALKLLRRWIFMGGLLGAAAGLLAFPRFPGNPAAWVGSGALLGTILAAFVVGVALLAGGLRISSAVAGLAAAAALGLAAAELAWELDGPFSSLGGVGLMPLRASRAWPWALGACVLLIAAGLSSLGNVSIESARRRASLVGQIRFAATLFDTRTLVVLRRQLALDLARSRPWLNVSPLLKGFPVAQRDVASFMRWPATRLLRFVALGCVAGLVLRLFWSGSTLMLVVAGVILYVAALDATEPVGQDADHGPLPGSFPISSAALALRHALVAATVMSVASGAAMVTLALTTSSPPPAGDLVFTAVVAAVTSVAGAIRAVRREPPAISALNAPSIELYGMIVAMDLATSPAIATLGLVPLLAVRGL